VGARPTLGADFRLKVQVADSRQFWCKASTHVYRRPFTFLAGWRFMDSDQKAVIFSCAEA
jgi:hypothetical protein